MYYELMADYLSIMRNSSNTLDSVSARSADIKIAFIFNSLSVVDSTPASYYSDNYEQNILAIISEYENSIYPNVQKAEKNAGRRMTGKFIDDRLKPELEKVIEKEVKVTHININLPNKNNVTVKINRSQLAGELATKLIARTHDSQDRRDLLKKILSALTCLVRLARNGIKAQTGNDPTVHKSTAERAGHKYYYCREVMRLPDGTMITVFVTLKYEAGETRFYYLNFEGESSFTKWEREVAKVPSYRPDGAIMFSGK